MPSARLTRIARLSTLLLGVVVAVTGAIVGGVPAQAAVTYSISGTVYLGSTATPAGAGEVLVRWGSSAGSIPAAGVLTDSSGGFTIPGLVNGKSYYLYYDYKGADAYPSLYHPGVVNSGEKVWLEIADADITGLSGVIPAPGPMSGRVTQQVSGEPYSDVEITAFRRVESGAYQATGSIVSPDSDGNYVIPNLPAGVYRIKFRNVGTAPVQTTYYGGGSGISTAGYATFGGAGDTAARDIAMPPLQTIGGTVSLGTAGNLAGAAQVVVSAWYWDPENGGNVSVPSVLTAATGEYTFTNLAVSADYSLGFTWADTGLVGYHPLGVSTVRTGTAAVTTKNVTMARANTIAGTVQLGAGGPMAGDGDVTVTFSSYGATARTATTTAGGSFVANTLGAGTYTLTFHYSGSGYPDFTLPAPITIPTDVTALAVVMPRGGTIAGQAFIAGTNRGGILPYANVVAHRVDPNSGVELGRYTTVADWKGRYSFAPVVDGRYWVEFTDNGHDFRTWGGGDKFDTPDYFDVVNADSHLGIDVEMYRAGQIRVYINAPLIDDFTDGAFTVELQIRDGSGWIATNYPSYGSWSRSIYDLPPRDYRVRVVYDGVLGHSETISPTITLAEYEEFRYDAYLASPEAPLVTGTLIKTESSPTVYLVDGPTNLVIVDNMAVLADAGLSTTVRTERAVRFQGRTLSDDPLTNVIRCGASSSQPYLATGGQLVSLADGLAATWEATSLAAETCAAMSISSDQPIKDALYVSTGSGQVYRVGEDQLSQPVLNLLDTGALVVNRYPVYPVNERYFWTNFATTQAGLPGALFKSSTSSAVFFSDSDRLLPVTSLSTLADFGLATTVGVIPQSFLKAFVIGSHPLVNLIECDGSYYIGSGGMKQPVAAQLVAGLDSVSLNADTCAAIPAFRPAPNYFVPPTVSTALFLKSPASSTVYFINAGGQKQVVTSTAQMNRLSAPVAARVLTVNAAYLASIPTGGALIAPGSLVKSSSSATIYLATDLSNLVPVRSVAVAADFGLPTLYTSVTPQTIADMIVASEPLSNAVVCGLTTYLASGGRLWPISPSAVGSAPGAVTALPEVLCASLLTSATPATPLYVRAPSGSTVYLVDAGTKTATLSGSVFLRQGPPMPVVLAVNTGYLASLTTVCTNVRSSASRSADCRWRLASALPTALPTARTPVAAAPVGTPSSVSIGAWLGRSAARAWNRPV